jgi:DNA-binding transcriptional ArsR family regulator
MTHKLLTTDAEVAAYVHRTRLAILRALGDRQATGSQVAAVLGVHPANLTRHLRVLVRAGLVVVAEKRDTGRNLEKYYRATAASFEVAPDLELTAPARIALAFARSDLSRALATLPAGDTRPVLALVTSARVRRRDLGRFTRALERLVHDFAGADSDRGDAYHLNLSLYPGEHASPADPELRLQARGRQP